jgi:Fe-S-cluster containining protein
MTAERGEPFAFSCQRSGNCCSIPGGIVRVTATEVAAIADHLDMPLHALRSRYLAIGNDRLAEGISNRCVFLQGGRETSCGIYPVRPEKCRTWPYWPELATDPEALHRAAALCPGLVINDPATGNSDLAAIGSKEPHTRNDS